MWDLELIPVYLLLSMWDGKKRLHSIIIESRISLFHVWKVLPFSPPRSLPSTLPQSN